MKESVRLSTGVFWTFIAITFNAATALTISILLGRFLGPSELGAYRLTRTTIYIMAVFLGLGIPPAITKYIAEHARDAVQQDQYLTSAIAISVVIGFTSMTVFYFFSPQISDFYGNGQLTSLFQLASPFLLLFLLNSSLQAYLVGLNRMREFSISVFLENLTFVLLSIGFVWLGHGASGVILALIIGSSANSIYLLTISGLFHHLNFFHFKKRTKNILTFGLHILASNAVNQVHYRTDVMAIGYFGNNDDVGYYSVGITLGNFFFLMPRAVQKVTYPATAKYWGNSQQEFLHELLERSTRYTIATLLLIAFPTFIFTKEIITLIFGDVFTRSSVILQILVIGMLIDGGLGQSIGGTLPGIGKPDVSARIAGFVAIVNVLLLITLIPIFGIVGAALATAIGYFLRGMLTFYYSFRNTNTPIPRNWLLKVFVTSTCLYGIYLVSQVIITDGLLFIQVVLILIQGWVTWMIYLTKEDRYFLLSLIKHYYREIINIRL